MHKKIQLIAKIFKLFTDPSVRKSAYLNILNRANL